MGGGIHAVGRDLVLDDGFGLEAEEFLGRSAGNGVPGENHYAFVGGPDAELVFGADHTEGFDAADLGFLDLEVAGEDGPNPGEEDFLPCSHVGSAADDLDGLGRAVVDRRDVEVIRVGVHLTGQHPCHDYPFKAAGNLFLLLHGVNLNTD